MIQLQIWTFNDPIEDLDFQRTNCNPRLLVIQLQIWASNDPIAVLGF